jgi:hypothetical protein
MDRQEIAAQSEETLRGEWCWSDAFKELHGSRPRHTPTHDELVSFWTTFPERAAEKDAEEAAGHAAGLARLEAAITETMEAGATSRVQAMRWLIDADGTDATEYQSVEHFFWGFNIAMKDMDRLTREFMGR